MGTNGYYWGLMETKLVNFIGGTTSKTIVA